MKWMAILVGAISTVSIGCSGIKDCKEDVKVCAEVINANAEACAQAYQLRQTDKKRKYCERAVIAVAEAKEKSAIPGLTTILGTAESSTPDDNHRREAAKALGRIADPATAPALIAAIELSAGTSSDPKDKAANRSNEEIATALGAIGDKSAVAPLLKLIDKSQDKYVVLKSVRALGAIGDKSATEALEKIARTDENKFMRKNAVIALGDIADPAAVDTLILLMFVEFQGVSFYREASLSLFQIGPASAGPLLDTMAGKNEEVNKHFEKSGGIKNSAIKAKCGFVLGDLRDKRAVDPLIEAFKGAAENNDPVVLIYAAAPLGALGDPKATPVLVEKMTTLDASQRDPLMRAVNHLGDRAAVAPMIEAMTAANFVDQCVKAGNSKEACSSGETIASLHGAQKAAADHASNLVDAANLPAFEKVVAEEKNEKIKKYFTARLARAKVAAECKADGACWAKKLESDDWLIREKAGWELGRLKDPKTLDALAKALSDKKSHSRYAAIQSYWSFGDARAIESVEATLEKEAGAADYIKVNEDLKRLLIHLKRLKS